jgi:hypothetical protein
VTLNHENGHYQTLTVTADTTFSFTNFPATATLGRIILDVTVAPGATNLVFPSAVIKADNVTAVMAHRTQYNRDWVECCMNSSHQTVVPLC